MARRKVQDSSRSTRKRLGRGLESLLSAPVRIHAPAEVDATESADPIARDAPPASLTPPAMPDDAQTVPMIALEQIQPNPQQPRQAFDEESLRSLAQSIEVAGLMQPIVVRPHPLGGFEIVAGERRWRAAKLLGLSTIPAIVRDLDKRTAAQWSLVENLQREDLNPIERAEAFRQLTEEFSLTHQQIADQVGLDRTSVTNHLRLLDLDDATQQALRSGTITMGHGRAILALANISDRQRLARQTIDRGWSVRELERRVRAAADDASKAASPPPPQKQAHLRDLERRLGDHLGTKVTIRQGRRKGSGSLTIAFYGFDDFEGLLQRLGFQPD